MDIILFDTEEARGNLLPLTYTRPVGCLRVGIDTIARKWQRFMQADVFFSTDCYLSAKFPVYQGDDGFYVASNVLPDEALAAAVAALEPGQRLLAGDRLVAYRSGPIGESVSYTGDITAIDKVYDIFLKNGEVLRADFKALTAGKPFRTPSDTVTIIGDPSQLYIHPDAGDVEGCVINVRTGPVYIGAGAEVMEGACLRGPIALCHGSKIKMGAKIYEDTTIGPWCKVGGEVENSVFIGYSNKAHDGFLGNAVIGEWCNLGGGCVASNLKNDYTEIKLWNYPAHRFLRTGLQFCGLIMGDHSKVGVNAMLNTATTLGVGVNIHGSGFPRPFLASFLEGSTAGFTEVPMAKFFDTARRVMARRGIDLTQDDIDILNHVRELAEQYR